MFWSMPYCIFSDIWSLGCVLYELTTLKHAVSIVTFLIFLRSILLNIWRVYRSSFKKFSHFPSGQTFLKTLFTCLRIFIILHLFFLYTVWSGKYEAPSHKDCAVSMQNDRDVNMIVEMQIEHLLLFIRRTMLKSNDRRLLIVTSTRIHYNIWILCVM